MAGKGILQDDSVQRLLMLIVSVGSLREALIEFGSYDIIVDLLSFSPGTTEYEAVVGIVGIAAVVLIMSVAEEATAK